MSDARKTLLTTPAIESKSIPSSGSDVLVEDRDMVLYSAIKTANLREVVSIAVRLLGSENVSSDADVSHWEGTGWDSSDHPLF